MTRLLARFSQLTQDELEDDLFIVEDNQEMPVSKMTLQEFEAAVQVPLLEILQYPYLLAHAKLSECLIFRNISGGLHLAPFAIAMCPECLLFIRRPNYCFWCLLCIIIFPGELSLHALCRIESIEITEKYKGVYLLLVHPNEKVSVCLFVCFTYV